MYSLKGEPSCSVCMVHLAAGVLQQIDDTLGKADGIVVVRLPHIL